MVKMFSIFKNSKGTLEPEGNEKLLSEQSPAQPKRKFMWLSFKINER